MYIYLIFKVRFSDYFFYACTIPSPSKSPSARFPQGDFSLLLLAVFHSLYVWTVSLTDADRATHSPMGSLCPVLTLSPRACGSSQGKGGCWSVLGLGGEGYPVCWDSWARWFGQDALLLSVEDGKNRRYRTRSGGASGENSVWGGQKKGLERVLPVKSCTFFFCSPVF